MQRIRKLSNDLKEALIPKSDQSQTRRKPSLRSGQPVQTSDIKKIANHSLGYLDPDAIESRSPRQAKAAIERWEQDSYNKAIRLARQQDAQANSIAFPSSSSHPTTRAKAQEKPVPVPSFDPKADYQEVYWDRDSRSDTQTASPYRYVLDSRTKAASATVPVKKLKRRCPYSPSKFLAMSLSTPAAPSHAQTVPPAASSGNPGWQVDTGTSTSHSTQSQQGVPAWPPEGPATVKRQQRTPKSSIDSLYRSQSDVHIPTGPARTTGHSRTASEPHPGDVRSYRGEPQAADVRGSSFSRKGAPGEARSSHRATSTAARDAKTSLQVRELSTSRSVQVESASLGRAASQKATIVCPSFVSTPPPVPQRETSARRRDEGATRARADKTHGRGLLSKKVEVEVSYITWRQVAQEENKRTHKELGRELAKWDLVPDAVPEPSPASTGTPPLTVRKRSAMLKDRDPRHAKRY